MLLDPAACWPFLTFPSQCARRGGLRAGLMSFFYGWPRRAMFWRTSGTETEARGQCTSPRRSLLRCDTSGPDRRMPLTFSCVSAVSHEISLGPTFRTVEVLSITPSAENRDSLGSLALLGDLCDLESTLLGPNFGAHALPEPPVMPAYLFGGRLRPATTPPPPSSETLGTPLNPFYSGHSSARRINRGC